MIVWEILNGFFWRLRMRFSRNELIILTFVVFLLGFGAFFLNFFIREGLHDFSSSQEQWSQFGGYIGGLFSAVFGCVSVLLLIHTYYVTLDQKDEQFVLKHLEQILYLNKRIVDVYNKKHPDEAWNSDDGMALITNKTSNERGGHSQKATNPRKIREMLIQERPMQVLYEFEQFLAALNYLVYWDLQRAEVGPDHDPGGFRSKFRTLISCYLSANTFTLIYNLSVLELEDKTIGNIPVDYQNRFRHLIDFVNRVSPRNPVPEDAA
jgi:hypothetical protein